jgi:hemerythrin superfamily protein
VVAGHRGKVATSTPTTRSRTKRPSSNATAPSAVALLTQDHRDVEALFKKFEGLGKRAHKGREATVGKMIVALSQHAVIEEQVFYPEVRARMTSVNDDVLEALEEHHVVKWTLSELEKMTSEDERYGAKVTVLMESVRHHVKEEEKGLFPQVRKALSRTELEEMGEQLVAAKKAAPTKPHPRSPDTPPGNVVAAALTAPLDAAANVIGSAAGKIRDAAR